MNEINDELMAKCFEVAREILRKYSLSETAPLMAEIKRLALVLFADATQPESFELIEIVEVQEKRESESLEEDDGEGLSDWAWLARIARIRKIKVSVTTKEGSEIGHFVQVGMHGGEMYGIFRRYDDTSRRIYHKDIREMKFLSEPSVDDIESEVWNVIYQEKGHYRLESTWNKRIALSDGIPIETAKRMAAANEMRAALKAIQNEYASNDAQSVTCVIRNEIWQQLIDALKKAGR